MADIRVCTDCLSLLRPKIRRFNVNGIACVALYRYEDPLKQWLIRYKEQLDAALAPVFLTFFETWLRVRYRGYCVVPAPSAKVDIERRGFAHLPLLLQNLGLPVLDCLEKTSDLSQKGKGGVGRSQMASQIKIKGNTAVRGRRLLLFDDVLTTGSTLKAMINELKVEQPQRMKGVVLMKT